MGPNCMKSKACTLIVLGVLVYLNGSYSWLSWVNFVALILVLLGAKFYFLAGKCEGKKK
tara:strand:- start:124 stop:300 length:177 start_codon:yes stop_codon:yes gene_type:complete